MRLVNKKSMEKSARELLSGSRLFPVLRDAYQTVFDREKLAARKAMLNFYSGFLSPGDVVFDVGANVGYYADTFLALGAHVVAVEPNPALCGRLKQIAQRSNLVIENCALGDKEGTAFFHVCSDPGLSTLSNEWYEHAKTSPIHGGAHWDEAVEVEVKTLDSLAAKYGVPAFVKIDVEGFEDHVLAGMSFRPNALSFEFHLALVNVALACLNHLRDGYRFNYCLGLETKFRLASWVDASEIEKALVDVRTNEEYGDVYCRKGLLVADLDRGNQVSVRG